MPVQSWKAYKGFFSYREATPFTADTDEFFEGRGRMTLPEPEYQVESDYNKLGSGEHGTKNELQSVFTPWSYTCDRLSEVAYLLSYFQGDTLSSTPITPSGATNARIHELRHLPIQSRLLPTFTYQMGPSNSGVNEVISGCVVNEMSITFSNGGNGVVEATFSGWGNRHYVSAGTITANATGSMSTGEQTLASEPLLNYKCLKAWAGSTATAPGPSSISLDEPDMTSVITLTPILNSVTISGSNGMTGADMMRAGGCGVTNDRTRGDRRYTLEFNMRKDQSLIDTDADRLADTQRAFEFEYIGPEIETDYRYALDFLFPVVQVASAPEDDASPISKAYTTEVFENSDGDSMVAYVQSAITVAYNSTK